MNELEIAQPFLTSLAIGLLIGLERQRRPGAQAGLRTRPLVGLLGCMCAMLQARHGAGWMLPTGLLATALMMVVAHWEDGDQKDAGTTTTVAVMLCFGLGALSWHGHFQLAVGTALAVTALLHFKDELHGFAARLSRDDVVAVLRFIVLSVLLLPLLPNRGYGPYEALNPYALWWMVVLISGLSLGGYLLLKLVGPGKGVPLIGVFGGLASSTATTLSFTRQVQVDARQAPMAQTVILIANLMVLIRLAVLAAVIAPAVLPALLPGLGGALLTGGAVVLLGLRRRTDGSNPDIEVGNPGELRAALGFALLYGLMLVIVAAVQDRAGDTGVYIAAMLAGLTDVDAISLSALDLLKTDRMAAGAVANAVLIAVLANLVFKGAMVHFIAGAALTRPVFRGFAAMAIGLAAGRAVGALGSAF